jgi:hypothetical protein
MRPRRPVGIAKPLYAAEHACYARSGVDRADCPLAVFHRSPCADQTRSASQQRNSLRSSRVLPVSEMVYAFVSYSWPLEQQAPQTTAKCSAKTECRRLLLCRRTSVRLGRERVCPKPATPSKDMRRAALDLGLWQLECSGLAMAIGTRGQMASGTSWVNRRNPTRLLTTDSKRINA